MITLVRLDATRYIRLGSLKLQLFSCDLVIIIVMLETSDHQPDSCPNVLM